MIELGSFNLTNNTLLVSDIAGYNSYLLKCNYEHIVYITGTGNNESSIILDVFANTNSYNAIGIKNSDKYNFNINFISDINIDNITIFGLTEEEITTTYGIKKD